MINLLALCLVFTSLLTAEVYSPSPTTPKQQDNQKKEDVIVKEGHRVVVVETYDEGGQHNTKVSISPPQDPISAAQDGKFPSGFVDNTKGKIKHAADVLPNIGQGISSGYRHHDQDKLESGHGVHGPGELICDAFGKCTHKFAKVIGKAKDQVSEKAHEAVSLMKEEAHEVKGVAQEMIHKKKRMEHQAEEKVHDAYEKAKDMASQKAHEAKEVVEDAYEKTKESAARKAQDVKECAKESSSKAEETAKSAKDLGKTIGSHIAANVSEQFENVKAGTQETRERVRRSFSHGVGYMGSTEGVKSLMGVINLLGFATAYGMSVWVTFISSYVLANALTRHQFGVVQSKIYPVYFRAMAYSIGVALLGHLVGHRNLAFSRKAEMFQVFNLIASISAVLTNAIYLEPLATKVMFEKLKIEKEEGRGRENLAAESNKGEQEQLLRDVPAATAAGAAEATTATRENTEQQETKSRMVRLNERLNSCSSFLNVVTLMSLTWHLVYLSQCLKC
ncbi:uncharacterized protein LOC8283246 [Ricinus communis]|uniref:uncharacterized protein LOC8283246 n=1 Tax=Ricinus communis TaxID=3988 RepID=UPI00201AFD6E|nr:uncharacterized protein LOC8283246 [Ricinus communis]